MSHIAPPRSSHFKELRIERGLTQEQLAVAAGVAAGLIRKMDTGYRPGHALKRRAVANALGVSESYLWIDVEVSPCR